MPYTTLEDREKFEPRLSELRERILESTDNLSKGDFTYIVYALALTNIQALGGESYTNISNTISCLIDAAEELRRKKLNPYEDKKIEENGDVQW
jgi:hypothetical protein